jgi:hypothetical protein
MVSAIRIAIASVPNAEQVARIVDVVVTFAIVLGQRFQIEGPEHITFATRATWPDVILGANPGADFAAPLLLDLLLAGVEHLGE